MEMMVDRVENNTHESPGSIDTKINDYHEKMSIIGRALTLAYFAESVFFCTTQKASS